jgi:chromosomal replication initiation ATPase DnaA
MGKIRDKIQRKNKNIPYYLIEMVVCKYFDVEKESIFIADKSRKYIPARRIGFYLMRTLSGIGISNIATIYGLEKNIVMNDTLKAFNLIKKDKEFSKMYKEIKSKVYLKTNGLRKSVPVYPSHYGLKKLLKERNI